MGLRVNERESADAPDVSPAALGISAWAAKTRRGVPGRARLCRSLAEVKRLFFLEPDPALLAYYMLKGLYDNAGKDGALVWLTRILGSGAVTALNFLNGGALPTSGTLTSNTASFPANLHINGASPYLAGTTTFIGAIDGGSSHTATFSYGRASLTGTGATYAAVAAASVLNLVVNGQAQTVVFTGSENSEATWLAAINGQLVGASALDATGEVSLQTDRFGSGASIQVLNTSTSSVLASLGLSAGTSTGSGNVADSRAVTAAEFKTVVEAAFSGSSVTPNSNGSVSWASSTTGTSSSVHLTGGTGVTPTQKVTGFNTSTHSGSAAGTTAVWQVTAGQYGQADPGTWANDKLYVEVVAPSNAGAAVDVVVYYKSDLDSAPVQVERHKNLTNANVADTVNNSTKGSQYIKIDLVGTPTALPTVGLGQIALSDYQPGDNGSAPAESAFATGLQLFNGQNRQIVLAPDLQTLLQATNLNAYAAAQEDCWALFTAPFGATDADLEDDFNALLASKSYLSGYRGWLEVDDERGSTIFVPALGHLIGAACIKKVRAHNNFPHIAPAGPSAPFVGVLSVDDGIHDEARVTRVKTAGFNPIVFQSGLGIFAKTSRTFSTTDKWYSAHIRLQANYFKASFLQTFAILEQEGNNPDTRRRLRNPILDFLDLQYDNGGLETRGGRENNRQVKCDEANNTEQVVNARNLVCDVSYRPVEIAEDININLVRTTEGLAAKEAA